MAETEPLTPAQNRALTAMLSERNVRSAAKAAKVGERTLWRWMSDPVFLAELRRQEGAMIDQAQRRLVSLLEKSLDAFSDVFNQTDELEKADLGLFLKPAERWTEAPLPSEEILQEEDFIKVIAGVSVRCTRYLVRKVVLDMEALMDPEKSRLVRKFTDSPKNGTGIDLHDVQGAAGLKLRAAQGVLDYVLRLRELNTLEERIRKLEEAQNERLE